MINLVTYQSLLNSNFIFFILEIRRVFYLKNISSIGLIDHISGDFMAKEVQKESILFMCIHNAARSQMAEGLFRHFYGEKFNVCSAGSDPQEVHHMAVQVMDEIGIDISKHRSKSLKEFEGHEIDYVVTVCGNALNACPFFVGGKKYFKQPFEDPSAFDGTEKEKIGQFRLIRDELKEYVEYIHKYNIQKRADSTRRGNCSGKINKIFGDGECGCQ